MWATRTSAGPVRGVIRKLVLKVLGGPAERGDTSWHGATRPDFRYWGPSPVNSISTKRKLFLTFAVVALVSGVGVLGTYAAFSATTTNTGNQVTSGTVILTDSDGGTGKLALFTGDNAPTATQSKCVRVTYSGSLTAAAVKIYRTSINAGANGKYSLRIERGGTSLSAPAADMNCTSFSQVSDAYATADLDSLGTTYGTGVDGKAAAATWTSGNTQDYRFTVTVKDGVLNGNTTSNDTGLFDFVWEARSA